MAGTEATVNSSAYHISGNIDVTKVQQIQIHKHFDKIKFDEVFDITLIKAL